MPSEPTRCKIERYLMVGGWIVACLVATVAAWMVHHQDAALRTHTPVEARVLSTHVERRRSGAGRSRRVTYRPVVRYAFEVDGVSYIGTQVTPLNESAQLAWAQAVADAFVAEQRVAAWVDPRNPRSTFLVRASSFTPYAFALAPLLFGGCLLLFLFGVRRPRPIPAVAAPDGASELQPQRPLRARGGVPWSRVVSYHVVGAPFWAHWCFFAVSPVHTWWSGLLCGVYVLVGMVPFGLAWRAVQLRRRLADVQLRARCSRSRTESSIEIELTQPAMDELWVECIEVQLVHEARAEMKVGARTIPIRKQAKIKRAVLAEPTRVLAGDSIRGTVTLRLPPRPEFGKEHLDRDARSTVWIDVRTKCRRTPAYRERFAFDVPDAASGVATEERRVLVGLETEIDNR